MSFLLASVATCFVLASVVSPRSAQAAGWANTATIATFGQLTTPFDSTSPIEDMFLIDDNNAIVTHGSYDVITAMSLNTFGVTIIAGQYRLGSDVDHATGTSGKINYPIGISKDTVNSRYIFSTGGHCIRTLGIASPYPLGTLAGACGTSGDVDGAFSSISRFYNPRSIVPKTITSADQRIYTVDFSNDKVRWYTLNGQTVNTLFGEQTISTVGGPYADARMRGPTAMGQSTSDTTSLYIHDWTSKLTLHVNLVSEFVKIIAGNGLQDLAAGTPTAALSAGWTTYSTGLLFLDKCRILTDAYDKNYLVLYDLTTNSVTTIAGAGTTENPPTDGTGASATFSTQLDNIPVAGDSTGKVWIADHPYVRTATLPTTSDQNLLPGGVYRGPCLTATATVPTARSKTKTLAQRTSTASIIIAASKTKTLAVKTSTKTNVPRTSTKTIVVPTATKTVVVSTKTRTIVQKTSTKTIIVPTDTKTTAAKTETKTLIPATPVPPTPIPPTPVPPTPVPLVGLDHRVFQLDQNLEKSASRQPNKHRKRRRKKPTERQRSSSRMPARTSTGKERN